MTDDTQGGEIRRTVMWLAKLEWDEAQARRDGAPTGWWTLVDE